MTPTLIADAFSQLKYIPEKVIHCRCQMARFLLRYTGLSWSFFMSSGSKRMPSYFCLWPGMKR